MNRPENQTTSRITPPLKIVPQRTRRMAMGYATALAMTFLFQNATAQTVNLGAANGFAVLGGTPKIENTGATKITGNVGLSPATGAGIIGFPPGQVIGTIYSVDAFGPAGSINNPGLLTAAKNDLITAYNDAAGRTGTITASNLGGLTLVAGIYTNPAFQITGALTLNGQGNPNSVWIFQTKAANGTTLTTASGSSVVLINGADACNVFWQVDSATLGTGSIFNGTILALTSITATTGATVNGRLLARNGAVTLDTNTIALEICKILINGPGATTKKTDNAAAVAALKEAIILAAQTADRISAVGLTTIYTLGFAQLDTEVFSVQQRLSDIRTSRVPDIQSPSPSPSHSEKNPWGSKNPWGGKSGKGGESIQPSQVQLSDEDRWGFFITGTGDFSTLGDTNNATGFRGTTLGTTLGVDCRLSDHFVVGASIGYSHTDSDIIANGKLKVDGGKAAIYAMYYSGGFYTEGLIGGGYNSYDTRRGTLFGTPYGNTSGEQFDAYLGVGYDVKMGRLTVTPMASVLYTLVGINGFDEHGSLEPLHIESQHESSLRTRLGPRVAFTTRVGGTYVTPSFSAQWQHEFLNDEFPFDARFADNASSLFTVHGPKIGRDSALLTAAVNVAWSRYAAYIAYQADLGRKNYENQTVLAGFRVGW